MDDLKLLSVRAAGLRAMLKAAASDDIPAAPGQSAMTTVGDLLGFGGGMTAIGGGLAKLYGDQSLDATGKAMANPATGAAQRGGNWLGNRLGFGNVGDKAWQAAFGKMPRSQQLAVRGSMYGGKAGLAGLGMLGAGLFLSRAGKGNDVIALRQHSDVLKEIVRNSRERAARLHSQLGMRDQELAGLRGRIAGQVNPVANRNALAQQTPTADGPHTGLNAVSDLLQGAGNTAKGWWDQVRQVYGG